MAGDKRNNDSSSNEKNGKKPRLGDNMKAPAIGIDLGTTYSCVGVFENGKVQIIVNDQGDKTTPSYVAFTHDEILIGKPAKEQATRNVVNTVFGVKRLLGRNYNDAAVQAEIKNYPFEVINDNKKPKIKIIVEGETKIFVPEEISSMILIKMKEAAEAYLGRSVSKAVITVPAYFNDAQRQATKDAAAIAQLEVLRIINEPTAAAIAYGLEKKVTKERRVMVFDLGGGTFDVSILKIADDFFEVVSTAGDTHLGGEDFDNRMVNHFVDEFKRMHKFDISQNKKAIRRLKITCERAKKILSSSTVASVDLDSLHEGIDFYTSITRARFEEINADLFRKTLVSVEKAIRDANIDKSQIQEVVLVGGSTRIPKVQQMLSDFFNGIELNKSINPDEAVAYGAAMQAAMLNGDESKEVKNLLLIDVTPLSLGIEVLGDGMDFVVKRNTTIPTKQTKIFTTSEDNQSLVDFKVYEGEHPVSKQNNLLGHFALKDVPPKPEDEGKFEVTFDIDANGILKVTALDKLTGKMDGITLKYNKNRLSPEEIERMIKDAEIFAAKLKKQKALPDAKNSLESYCNELKSTVRGLTLNDVIIDSDKDMILNKCDEIIKWLRTNKSIQVGEIEQKQSELEAIDHTFIVMAKDPTKKEEKYREILSVGKAATKKEVREGYKLAVKKFHPDKTKGDKVFAQLMFRVAVHAKKFLVPLSSK